VLEHRQRSRVNRRLPRYHRIADTLRERIRGGEWAPGAPLPNQRRLARDFGVTLMTLRQALQLLERDDLITRRHGLGTFVAAPSIDYEVTKLRRFAAALPATPLGQVLEFRLRIVVTGERGAVSAGRSGRREGRQPGWPTGAPAFESARVSFDAAGQPVVFDRVFIPGDRFRITRELHY